MEYTLASRLNSSVQYGELRWDLDRRRTRELVRIGSKLRELPQTDEALCKREISWTKVVELSRVAMPEHEEAWLKLAMNLNCKQLKNRGAARQRLGQAERSR